MSTDGANSWSVDLTLTEDKSGSISAWIKSGKTYKDVPDYVSNALLQRLSLSGESKSILPSPELTISDLIGLNIPSLLNSMIFTDPNTCFSDMSPNVTTAFLLNHDIPSREFLTRLRAAAGQAMLDGKLSIVDWKDKNVLLPFESLGFWEFLLEAALAKKKWSDAKKWIDTLQGLPNELITRTEHVLNHIPWRGRLLALGGHVSVTEMADYFSRLELSGSHVDTLLELLKIRAQSDLDLLRGSKIVQTTFFDFLSTVENYNPASASTEVQKIGEYLMLNHNSFSIFGVAYSPPHHWAAVRIDISPHQVLIYWGDSIQRKCPSSLMKGIKSFLNAHISPAPSIIFRDDLECAQQTDAYSCPIIAVNTIKHHLSGDELWTEKNREVIRISEFLSAIEFCFPEFTLGFAVSTPSPDLFQQNDISKSEVKPTICIPDVKMTEVSLQEQIPVHSFFHPRKPPTKAQKRSRSIEDLKLPPPTKKRARVAPEAKPEHQTMQGEKERSKTAMRKLALNQQVRDGTLVLDQQKWNKYTDKLKNLDPNVEVNSDDPRKARHSRCAQYLIMATVYDVTVFRNHVQRCNQKRPLNPAANTRTLTAMGVLSAVATQNVVAPIAKEETAAARLTWPCPGLTANDDERISQYLTRVSTLSAGGISGQKIAQRVFGNPEIRGLKDYQREALRVEKTHTHRWRNDHELKRVVAIGAVPCLQQVSLPLNYKPGDTIPPCASCSALLTLRAFQTAIQRPVPERKNRIYTPYEYQNRILAQKMAENQGIEILFKGLDPDSNDDRKDIFLRFARQFSEGHFDKKPVFLDLVEVMTDTAEREADGRGMQNKHYPPAINDWLHELQCIRPEAYRSFVSAFGGRTERSFAHIRSLKPSFTQGISPQTLERAKQYVRDYNYPEDAPLALGVDDTKLLPSLRPYFDAQKKKWFLVGSVGEPLEVMDIDLLQKQIADASDLKAEKLRLWTLNMLLPNVPPLILAATPIASNMKATDLADMEISLLKLLLDPAEKFNLISLGSDGTIVEREARRELVRKKFLTPTYHHIRHPDPSQPPIKIEILRKDAHAMAVIQDPQHARKTIRNGMFTGAKCLTLGRYLVNYEQVRTLAFKDGSPLYTRDVEKLDRQDDRAAARLFSGHTLEFAIDNLADELGLIIYLFVFGEMVDAYQSRKITHLERIKMVLRALFFKDLWKKFLNEGGYPLAQHFMSKEADDITDIIIDGLIALILIHRDDLDSPFPLLPWEHGSEPDEHIFGFLRDYIPDFSMLDVLRLVPKIGVRLMAACKRKNLKADFRKTASGYSHSYFDGTDADLHGLSEFPTDEEIQSAAAAAYDEAMSLWVLLGYSPGDSDSPTETCSEDKNEDEEDEPQDEDSENQDLGDAEVKSDRRELEDALAQATQLFSKSLPSNTTDEALDECGYAAAALNFNDIDQIESLPEEDPASLDEIRSSLAVLLSAIAASTQSGHKTVMDLIQQATGNNSMHIPVSDHPSNTTAAAPSSTSTSMFNVSETDLKQLVEIRMKNQCREEAEGVRTRKKKPRSDSPSPDGKTKPPSDRQMLAKKIHEIVRLESERGMSSGLSRRARWEKTSAGSVPGKIQVDQELPTGNSANAQVAARVGAKDLIKRRRKAFAGISGVEPDDLATAKVDVLSPLTRGSFGVVVYEGELMIAKIITMYEKGGGKVARHGWVSEATSIGSVSYLPTQIWRLQTRRNPTRYFRAVWHPKLMHLGLPRFAHLPASAFILRIPPSSVRSSNEATLELTFAFFNGIFSNLFSQEKSIVDAVAQLLRRPRKTQNEDGEVMIE